MRLVFILPISVQDVLTLTVHLRLPFAFFFSTRTMGTVCWAALRRHHWCHNDWPSGNTSVQEKRQVSNNIEMLIIVSVVSEGPLTTSTNLLSSIQLSSVSTFAKTLSKHILGPCSVQSNSKCLNPLYQPMGIKRGMSLRQLTWETLYTISFNSI